MAAAETGALATVGAAGLALAWVSGLDGPSLIGAFSGAMVYVMLAQEIGLLSRIGLFLASWGFGYHAPLIAADMIGFDHPFLSAALGGLLCVTLASSVLEYFRTGNIPAWLGVFKRGAK